MGRPMKRTYFVRARWDADAGVYYSESDIDGLAIEAETLDEFESAMFDIAPELILANHIDASSLASTPLKDLVPAIIWERPEEKTVRA